MIGKMNESLKARLYLKLTKAGQEVWSSKGTTGGLDVSGDTSLLESSRWRK